MLRDEKNPSPESRVRGLMLGLALGDAVGSRASEVPEAGVLKAGVATQLAAWTVEASLRTISRSGSLEPSADLIARHAYQRWAMLRGAKPDPGVYWKPFQVAEGKPEHEEWRGWLVDVPGMRKVRGSSPSTMGSLQSGKAARSGGCQAFLRVLPIAVLAISDQPYVQAKVSDTPVRLAAEEWARRLALMTHDDGDDQNLSVLGVRMLESALLATDGLRSAVERIITTPMATRDPGLAEALWLGLREPCVVRHLEQIAPDKTARSALLGGIYVAASFPDQDTVAEAIEFAGWAKDGDSVGAFAGAILGARHGFESLPAAWLHRLELGWAMDRLAADLCVVLEAQRELVADHQLRDEIVAKDPWWQTKYPMI